MVDRSIGRPISHSVNRSVDRSVGKAHAGARSQVQVAFFSSIGGLKLKRKLGAGPKSAFNFTDNDKKT